MQRKSGHALLQISVAAVILVILLLAIHFVTHSGSPSNKPSLSASSTTTPTSSAPATNATSPYATLSPATVASKAAECNQTVAFSSNGDSGPVTCPNGDLNVDEWNVLAALEPSVFVLGYGASAAQVQAALCADVGANVSNPIEATVYQIAALYYGWNFTSNPSVVLTNGTCKNVDD
ncbi:MAG TPA: hypothetical protein VMR95_00265 [Candidatus Binatia bacterium]|nr:hypothetical protein [Candidatus Binatia bacterium]